MRVSLCGKLVAIPTLQVFIATQYKHVKYITKYCIARNVIFGSILMHVEVASKQAWDQIHEYLYLYS